jgi:hypothetical protein
MLQIITSDALAPRHGFFTRKGGASSGIFEGLNCGRGSSDQAEAVAINRGRAAAALEVAPEALVSLHQVHSADVVTVSAPLAERPRADAMVTAVPGLALAILTADCMPVLLADPQAGVVGAAHAGWRGAQAGVLQATVAAMAALGARPDRIAAAIGPSISQAHYEVGDDFVEAFLDEDRANARFFAGGPRGRAHFDLPGFGLAALRAAGVGQAAWTGHCTYADPDRFFSYRRATHRGEADYGRLLSAIRL